jgi:hypothetical protein
MAGCEERSLRSKIFALVTFSVCIAMSAPAGAIPIFAQRYHLSCETCHSVLPELNDFGKSFRAHGYRLPLPKHGTTGVAIRYQMEYEATPPAGNRRYTPGGVLLSNADIGNISAFIHYNFGAGGGPAGLYLGYLATYDAHTATLYRAGLFELPLAQSPGQRLDDLAPYGYYGTHVGLNDLSLSSPRWGVQVERTVGASTLDFTADLGEFKGAAYGGRPIPTGEISSARQPELGFFIRTPIDDSLEVGGEAIEGTRRIVQTAGNAFTDTYNRDGLLVHGVFRKFDAQAEQWWGSDTDVDGFGSSQTSSGGYARLKYYVSDHAYLGIRYDASANPIVTRDVVYYGAFQLLPDVRFLLQQVQPIGGKPQLGAGITVGFPPPLKL